MRHMRGGRIAMIFQEPMTSLSPLHTIGDQVSEALMHPRRRDQAEARERTIEVCAGRLPRPEARLRTYPFELSGGLRQRAMIAMALITRPALLIADEPTTALDVTTQAQILDLIKELQVETGMSVLLITHDLGRGRQRRGRGRGDVSRPRDGSRLARGFVPQRRSILTSRRSCAPSRASPWPRRTADADPRGQERGAGAQPTPRPNAQPRALS